MKKEQEDYYKAERVNNFWNSNYIEYEINGNKNRNLPPEEYLYKIKPYLRNIISNLQNSDTWKFQLTITINFIVCNALNEQQYKLFVFQFQYHQIL